jgi:hypothetical protein
MKYLILILIMTLQACAAVSGLNPGKGFTPVTSPANDTPQFRIDQQACLSEVNKVWALAQQENVAVIQFRQCLVNKGYRLLS